MKIKFFPLLSTAVLAATAGFVAGSAIWHSDVSSTAVVRNGADGSAANGADGSAAEASTADSGKNQRAPKNTATPGSGGSGSVGELTARFAALLKQSGIDPSWAAGLAAGGTSGFEGLLERMKSLPAGQQERLREFLLGRWAELDPAGGVAFFKSRKDEDGLADLFRQWQRLDFPAAAAKAGEEGDKILRRTLRDKALLDPAGLLGVAGGPAGFESPEPFQHRKRGQRPRVAPHGGD